MRCQAKLTDDGLHRLWLTRDWDSLKPTMVVIGLNPSTADATQDDPTIRRCIGFAKREGCGALTMLNLYTFRATDPDALFAQPYSQQFHPENEHAHQTWCLNKSRKVVAAWGAEPRANELAIKYAEWADVMGIALWCLGRTKSGQPRHPLYVKGDAPLLSFNDHAGASQRFAQ